MRVRDSSSAISALRQEFDSQKSKIETLTRECRDLKSTVGRLENKVNNSTSGRDRAGGGPPATYKCNKCGVIGDHWVSKCPLKNQAKDDEAKDE